VADVIRFAASYVIVAPAPDHMFPLASYVAFVSLFVAAFAGIGVVLPLSTFEVRFPNPSYPKLSIHAAGVEPAFGVELVEINLFNWSY
jgi:hypothetical protein